MRKEYSSTSSGGYHKDYLHVAKRVFDDKRRKRELKVSCHKYDGIGIHYYISGYLETNYWIDEKENILRTFWDDNDYDQHGNRSKAKEEQSSVEDFCRGKFTTIAAAQGHIKKIKKKYGKKYKVVDNDAQEELKWYYKEGD